MFDSVFQDGTTILMVFVMAAVALATGVIYSFIVSRKLRASKGVFITSSIMPMIVSVAICLLGAFLSTTTTTVSRIATLAVALGLIRFRSVNGTAEEMVVLLGSVISGLIFGLGYLTYAVIATLVVAIMYVVLSSFAIFKNKKFSGEKLLKITIPESLDYSDVFESAFSEYLKENELVEVKTTGMGSMFKLSYRVVLKDQKQEKSFIDELRIRNGNLEISMLPYVEPNKTL
ncbi:MAG: DUF4956 domain-containing protein [Clostridiales bacterium]|nr:DUF4956 domain-containing protein [Clostridiales bacterium]